MLKEVGGKVVGSRYSRVGGGEPGALESLSPDLVVFLV